MYVCVLKKLHSYEIINISMQLTSIILNDNGPLYRFYNVKP